MLSLFERCLLVFLYLKFPSPR